MTGFKIRNVPVIKDGVIYGIVTLGDISDHKYT
jgi:CBS domain-containing protein